jgi:hypothetical protein
MNLRLLIALAIIAILATAAYGFAASNTFSGGKTRAGDGETEISGYQVSNIHYNLNSDPTLIDSVQFELNAPATTVKISLDQSGSWISTCSNGGSGNTWTCPTTGETVAGASYLRVVAAQ